MLTIEPKQKTGNRSSDFHLRSGLLDWSNLTENQARGVRENLLGAPVVFGNCFCQGSEFYPIIGKVVETFDVDDKKCMYVGRIDLACLANDISIYDGNTIIVFYNDNYVLKEMAVQYISSLKSSFKMIV